MRVHKTNKIIFECAPGAQIRLNTGILRCIKTILLTCSVWTTRFACNHLTENLFFPERISYRDIDIAMFWNISARFSNNHVKHAAVYCFLLSMRRDAIMQSFPHDASAVNSFTGTSAMALTLIICGPRNPFTAIKWSSWRIVSKETIMTSDRTGNICNNVTT